MSKVELSNLTSQAVSWILIATTVFTLGVAWRDLQGQIDKTNSTISTHQQVSDEKLKAYDKQIADIKIDAEKKSGELFDAIKRLDAKFDRLIERLSK